ncbi:hypothetical protein J2T60_000847 [Natronospira proteinivora]|uniref:Competence protein ComFB n=1 Tax=Natronospira proteinivora TaxID=1807133 RepID=A0ABT1G715_9GAMM|nr:hypothetical protein [Natronospira proteinivora]
MFQIKNFYEQLVQDYLWKRMEGEREEPWEGFFEDVACLALNRLPCRYVRHTVDLGAHLGDQDFADMESKVAEAVDKAIEQVRTHPRHRD